MTDSAEKVSSSSDDTSQDGPIRRNFLVEFMAIVVGAITGLFGLMAGLLVFIDPLVRKNKVPLAHRDESSSNDGFVPVATLAAIPQDGSPVRFPVIMDVVDAWTFSPDQPVGAVWIRRIKGDELLCFHATCPHAGCSVALREGVFHCPCHNSAFDMEGNKVDVAGKKNPSPREMDQLEFRIEDGNIKVKFEDYYTGIHDKKPKL